MADLNNVNSASSAYALDPSKYSIGDFSTWAESQGYNDHMYSWTDNVGNAVTGYRNRLEAEYNEKQNLLNKQYEQDSLASARAWEEYLDSTKYQRASKDLEDAGLNKWLAVQSGVSGSGTSSSVGSSANGVKNNVSSNKNGESAISKLITSAVKILLLAAIK